MRPELIARAQHGDREAFDALATAMYDRLYAVARRVLRDGHAAEDAVQEALIRGWRDLRSLREPDRFEAWMHRVLIHACQDQHRRGRRFTVQVREVVLEPVDPNDDYARVIHRDELDRAFLQLSVEHRAVLVLTHYLGMSAPEIGAILGIPPGTVYSRLHNGHRKMRDALSQVEPSSDAVAETGQ